MQYWLTLEQADMLKALMASSQPTQLIPQWLQLMEAEAKKNNAAYEDIIIIRFLIKNNLLDEDILNKLYLYLHPETENITTGIIESNIIESNINVINQVMKHLRFPPKHFLTKNLVAYLLLFPKTFDDFVKLITASTTCLDSEEDVLTLLDYRFCLLRELSIVMLDYFFIEFIKVQNFYQAYAHMILNTISPVEKAKISASYALAYRDILGKLQIEHIPSSTILNIERLLLHDGPCIAVIYHLIEYHLHAAHLVKLLLPAGYLGPSLETSQRLEIICLVIVEIQKIEALSDATVALIAHAAGLNKACLLERNGHELIESITLLKSMFSSVALLPPGWVDLLCNTNTLLDTINALKKLFEKKIILSELACDRIIQTNQVHSIEDMIKQYENIKCPPTHFDDFIEIYLQLQAKLEVHFINNTLSRTVTDANKMSFFQPSPMVYSMNQKRLEKILNRIEWHILDTDAETIDKYLDEIISKVLKKQKAFDKDQQGWRKFNFI